MAKKRMFPSDDQRELSWIWHNLWINMNKCVFLAVNQLWQCFPTFITVLNPTFCRLKQGEN